MCVTRHVQISQNNKFAISLQYLKQEFSNEVDFFHADMHENLLQIDSMILRLILSLLMGMIKHSQITESNKFTISLQYLKKEVRNGVHFWHTDKRQSFYKYYPF